VVCLRAAWAPAWAAWTTKPNLNVNCDSRARNGPAVLLITMAPEIVGWSFMKDRRTGQPVGPLTPVYKEDWPYEMPRRDQRLWRYVDLWKFETLFQNSALYFRRADKLSDVGEGMLSKEGVRGTLRSQIAFNAAYNIASQSHAIDIAAHEITRGCMFINCWNIAEAESARMWAEYTTTEKSIAMSTTLDQLLHAVSANHVLISRVKYVDEDTPRAEFSHTTPFFYKDTSFSFENEFRLVRPLIGGEQVSVDDEKDFGKSIHVDVARLIDRIVMHKDMPRETHDLVATLVKTHCPTAELFSSSVEPNRDKTS
jgi:hypothetical protein